MALTKRFFTALAAEYRALRPAHPNQYVIWEQMIRTTAHALAAQNGMFNYAKFYEACGLVTEPASAPA